MQELVELSIKLHVIFIYAMIALGILNLGFILTNRDFITFTKRVRFVSPQYYMMLASIFFTGLIAFAVNRFTISLPVILMIVAFIFMFVLSIKSFKIFKRTHPKNESATKAYRNFALKKYSFDIALLVIISIIAYIW